METIFWTSIALPLLIGVTLVLFDNFFIQPLARKNEKEQQENSASSNPNKKRSRINLFIDNIVKKLASVSSKTIILATAFFLFGVVFTIFIAITTNTNLANIGIFDPETKFSRMCGNNDTGIVGQVTYSGYGQNYYGKSGLFITTLPPTSTVISDDQGYFYICNISVSDYGQQYTINAKEEKDYGLQSYQGSVDVTVFPNKKSIAIIRLIYK